MTARPIDIAQIVGMLTARTPALCAELLPHGVQEGGEWRVGSVAGEPGRSMAVHLAGAKQGVWCDFGGAPDDRGDALDLVASVLFRGDKKRAVKWALGWLGLASFDPQALAIERRQAEAKKRDAGQDEARKAKIALGLFLGAQEHLRGTPADTYLKSRGIDFAALGRQPGCLRFSAGLADAETGCFWPTLVAAISGPEGKMAAVHRTFLEEHKAADGSVVCVTKAPIEDPKQTLGRYVGGCIRLWRGATNKPLRDAVRGEWVIIGEGIEDVASAVMMMPDTRALVAVSLANMGALRLPDAIEGVWLLGQNDPQTNKLGERHPAQRALERAIANFHAQGKRVRLFKPPPGIKDVNDLLTKGGNAA